MRFNKIDLLQNTLEKFRILAHCFFLNMWLVYEVNYRVII